MTAYNASATLQAAIPGGVHRDKVRGASTASAVTTPYCVFTVAKGKDKKLLAGGDVIDHRLVTFKIFGPATSSPTVDAAVAALRTAFHCRPLTDTSPTYAALSVIEEPIDEGRLLAAARRAGEAVWQGIWAMEVTSQI